MQASRTPQANAAAEWTKLGDRLRTVTPQTLSRAMLTVAVGAGALALTVATWPAALPFIVGGILAYELLPIVDTLDRVMPRALAALVAVLATVALVVGVLVLVLPPLALASVRFAAGLPTPPQIDAALTDLQNQLGALPEGSAAIVAPTLGALASAVRDILANASGNVDDLVRGVVNALLNALGALLGLIVLPTWMLTMMTEKRRARSVVDRRVAPWLRDDLWAIVSIADRAAGAYLRGYVIVAALIGVLVYLGAELSPRIGGPTFQEPAILAVLAGATQVIPVIGAILGLVPALLILPIDPNRAIVYVAIFLAARLLGGSLLGARLMERRLGVHPAILVPGVVMIGQFGLLWLLLSAPIVSMVVNVVRYLHGRLSEPPRPAGVLPGTAVTAIPADTRTVRAPSTYRPGVHPAPLASVPAGAVTPPPGR
jgi:predicted PurR-regulated permease PerM